MADSSLRTGAQNGRPLDPPMVQAVVDQQQVNGSNGKASLVPMEEDQEGQPSS